MITKTKSKSPVLDKAMREMKRDHCIPKVKPKLSFEAWLRKHKTTLRELYADFQKDTGAVSIMLRGKEIKSDFEDFCRGMFAETIHAGGAS